MKNKKNVVLALVILLGVVALGIGYALSSQTLTVNGTAKAKTTDEFDVSFTGAGTTGAVAPSDGTATAAATAKTQTGTCTVELKNVNSEATCTFEFQNYSPEGINATIDVSKLAIYDTDGTTVWANGTTGATDPYFDITMTESWTGTKTLTPGDKEDFTFTVKLKKANVSDTDVTKTFVVKLDNITAVQA